MLTVKQVAAKLKVSPSTVKALIESGRLKGADVGLGRTKRYRVDEAKLDEFVNGTATVVKPIRKGKRMQIEEIVK